MERKEFVESEPGSWWFIDPRNDSPWYEARRALVELRGWQEPYWLQEQPKLEELYGEMESRAPQLLRDLNDLHDTDEAKIAWIAAVHEALAPVGTEAEVARSGAEPIDHDARGAREESSAPIEPPKEKTGSPFAKKDAQQPVEPSDSPDPAEVPAPMREGVERVIQSLSGEGSAELREELGVSEDQLAELANDPGFAQMVHDEVARLHQANS